MQLSIRDASRFVIGAAIIRDMTMKNSPEAGITFENVSVAALRGDSDSVKLRLSITKLADQEAHWFRSTPPHMLSTERVMHTRVQEMQTLNNCHLAALATLEFGAAAAAGSLDAKDSLQASYQAAIQSIDEMPGSTTERRGLFQTLKAQGIEAHGDSDFILTELNLAQEVYLKNMMTERLSAYQTPSHERSDDLDLSM